MNALLATVMVVPMLLDASAYTNCPTSTLRETQTLILKRADYRKLLKDVTKKPLQKKMEMAVGWNLKDPHKTEEWCKAWNDAGMPCVYAEHVYSLTADFCDERKIAHMKNLMAIYVKSGLLMGIPEEDIETYDLSKFKTVSYILVLNWFNRWNFKELKDKPQEEVEAAIAKTAKELGLKHSNKCEFYLDFLCEQFGVNFDDNGMKFNYSPFMCKIKKDADGEPLTNLLSEDLGVENASQFLYDFYPFLQQIICSVDTSVRVSTGGDQAKIVNALCKWVANEAIHTQCANQANITSSMLNMASVYKERQFMIANPQSKQVAFASMFVDDIYAPAFSYAAESTARFFAKKEAEKDKFISTHSRSAQGQWEYINGGYSQ